MLIVLGEKYEDWPDEIRSKVSDSYGTVLNYSLPEINSGDTKEVEEKAVYVFNMIAAAEDSCANQPKPFAVFLSQSVFLPFACKLISFLSSSKIKVMSWNVTRDGFVEIGV